MNVTGQSLFNQAQIEWAIRLKYSPMPELDMEVLSRQLNAMRIGELREIGKTFESMMEKDAELAINADKRYSDVAGLEYQIVSDGSPDGDRHKEDLTYFYENLTATQALEQDAVGGVDTLVHQFSTALAMKYSMHEMLFRIDNPAARQVTAEFRQAPIWFFESRRGYLGYLQNMFDVYGQPCRHGEWLTGVGLGCMRPLSCAYALKWFAMRDWGLFNERYGSGFLEAITDATEDTPEWDSAREALETLANDAKVLHNRGVEFKILEMAARNANPFQPMTEAIDRLYAKVFRGVDLATSTRGRSSMSGSGGGRGDGQPVGASIQKEESGIYLLRDAKWVTGYFNERIDRAVIRFTRNQEPRAWFVLMPDVDDMSSEDLAVLQGLVPMGFRVSLKEVYKRFRWTQPSEGEACLQPAAQSQADSGLDQGEQYFELKQESNVDGAPAPRTNNAGEGGDKPTSEQATVPAKTNDGPIAPGARPGAVQLPDPNIPANNTQINAAAAWSMAGMSTGKLRSGPAGLRALFKLANASTAAPKVSDEDKARFSESIAKDFMPLVERMARLYRINDPKTFAQKANELLRDWNALGEDIKADPGCARVLASLMEEGARRGLTVKKKAKA